MKTVRFLPLAAVLVLAACTPAAEGVSRDYLCALGQTAPVPAVDWDKAETIDVAIRDGVFDPRALYLKVGQPAVLRFMNNDGVDRYYADSGFLLSAAVARVSVGSVVDEHPCANGLRIGPGHTAEVRLVPMTAGRFYFQDAWAVSPALLAEMLNRGGDGFITVRP